MPRSIIVPLDGSAFSAGALPVATALAVRDGAALHLVSVYTPVVVQLPFPEAPTFDSGFDEAQRAALGEALERLTERLRAEVGVAATCALLDGDPAEELAGEAARRGADLIVLTTHGAGGFARAWLGSVADELVRRSPTPTLLIRPPAATDGSDAAGRAGKGAILAPVADFATVPLAASTDASRFRRVLVPLDGSPLAEEIIAPALDLGVPGETTLTLLRVVRVPRTVLAANETYWMPKEEAEMNAAQKTAADYLDAVAARLRAAGYAADTAVVLDHDPARAILREGTARGVDLIAISTHARSGLARLRLGSVADKVVRGGPCPTLVARPRGVPTA